jgi:hypothetical protein
MFSESSQKLRDAEKFLREFEPMVIKWFLKT